MDSFGRTSGRSISLGRGVLDDAFDDLLVGTPVAFVEEQGEKGPQASSGPSARQTPLRRSLNPSPVSGIGCFTSVREISHGSSELFASSPSRLSSLHCDPTAI